MFYRDVSVHSSFTILAILPFFLGTAEYNFTFVPHFTRFLWSNNAHVKILQITSKVNEYLTFVFSHCTAAHEY